MTIFAAIIQPAFVALFVWLFSWRIRLRGDAVPHQPWGGALAVSWAYVVGHMALVDWPRFPPPTAAQKLFYLVLAAGIVLMFEQWWSKRWWSRVPLRLGITAGFVWWQVANLIEHTWSAGESVIWVVALLVVGAGLWELLDRLADRNKGLAPPLMLWLAASGAAVTLALTGSALLGQLGGVLASIMGVAVVLGFFSKNFTLRSGAAGLYALILVSLLLQGYFYSELPAISASCLFAAPVVASIHGARRFQSMRRWKKLLTGFGLTAIPVAIAVGYALYLWLSEPSDSYYY